MRQQHGAPGSGKSASTRALPRAAVSWQEKAASLEAEIAERKQSEHLLAEQNRLLELIVSGHALDACLTELTRAIARLQPRTRASVLLADVARTRFLALAAADIAPSFGAGLQDAPINELAIGTCATAVYSGEPIACADIAHDERWSPAWRDLCVAHGILACHSEPAIGSDGQPLASLMLCFDEARSPSDWERRIAQFGAHVAAIVIERDRTLSRLRESEARLTTELADAQRLQHISSQLIREDDLDALYRQILDAAVAVMRSDMGSMQMLNVERNELRLLAETGFNPASAAFWEWVQLDSVTSCGAALRTGERVVIPDIEACDFLTGTQDLDFYRLSGIRAVQSTPLVSRGGRVVGMISTQWRSPHQPAARELGLLDVLARQAADLIERRWAEDALHQSQERLRVMAESMPQKVFTAKPNGDVDYFNPQWMEFTGLSFEQMRDQGWAQFIHPEDVEENVRVWQRSIETGEPFYFEHRFRRADGVYRWHVTRAVPMRDGEGRVTMWIGSDTDIDEQKQLEARKNAFISMTSHELKTPVTSLKAFTQILQKRLKQEADSQTQLILDRIDAQLTRLTSLIGDLLDMNRMQDGTLALHPTRFAMDALVRETVENVQATTTSHELQLEGKVQAQVEGDRDRLGQVLINLLTNAVKYSPQAVRVIVRLSQSRDGDSDVAPDWVEVAVQDFGIGIAQEEQERIFEQFYQVADREGSTFPGLGIGLHIARTLVERHKGRLWLESQPGAGSTFHIALSVAAQEQETSYQGDGHVPGAQIA
ncbi:MAG TPA: ATP-binding protein [Ktedonobacterales bacterium]